jgi:hypothetical protein
MEGNKYGNNKLYYQMWVAELQERLSKQPLYEHIVVNGVHPGYVNSGIWSTATIQTRTDKILQLLARWFAITSYQGGLALVNAATNERLGKVGGLYINRIWESTPMPYCEHKPSRLMLWEKLDQALGLTEKGLLKLL